MLALHALGTALTFDERSFHELSYRHHASHSVSQIDRADRLTAGFLWVLSPGRGEQTARLQHRHTNIEHPPPTSPRL